jgi:hypothetical protein
VVEQSVLQSPAQLVCGGGQECVEEVESGGDGVLGQPLEQSGGDDGDQEVQECWSAEQVRVVHAPYSAEVLSWEGSAGVANQGAQGVAGDWDEDWRVISA